MIASNASPRDFAQAGWADIEPHYARLATGPLEDVEAWLRDWSRFEELLGEAQSVAHGSSSTRSRWASWSPWWKATWSSTMPEKGAAEVRWASRVNPALIRRLSGSDARGHPRRRAGRRGGHGPLCPVPEHPSGDGDVRGTGHGVREQKAGRDRNLDRSGRHRMMGCAPGRRPAPGD